MPAKGRIVRIVGPVVIAEGMKGSQMYEVVYVGEEKLIGEIIGLEEDKATIQVYEETVGLTPGEPVEGTGRPLSVELGPGLIGSIYDGVQRPLPSIWDLVGPFIRRGVKVPPLSRDKKWHFIPKAEKGEKVEAGDFIGVVKETPLIDHYIMVPPGTHGKVVEVAPEGEYTIMDTIAVLETPDGKKELNMVQIQPVRVPRPYKVKLPASGLMATGQRIVDLFFPIAKGGTAAVPGDFGTGKTVLLQQFAKWSQADVCILVGCGERGNEMADVLTGFMELKDPRSGRPLLERTIVIANTSNMPVAARESSVYSGITIAEYFRDMGYDVFMMADSTSRWCEAMREVSGRLEEMPGEEGFPAYLASRLAEFYERTGRVITLGKQERIGSVTVIGAVSPPGGDFSEPVTQNTLRIVKVFLALSKMLAERRHFPAIDWLESYSLYIDAVADWWNKLGPWKEMRTEAMAILKEEADLQEIVRIVGPDVLPEREKMILESARMIRDDLLYQSALHEVDTYCPPEKSIKMMEVILKFHKLGMQAVQKGVSVKDIKTLPIRYRIARMKELPYDKFIKEVKKIEKDMEEQFQNLIKSKVMEAAAR